MPHATRRLRIVVGIAASLLAASALPAQVTPAAPPPRPADSATRLRAIQIEPGRIFDSAEAKTVFYRTMNSLHFTTRPAVIRQQLLFRVGQPWDTAEVAETERNLRSLGIFRAVMIDSVMTDSGLVARVVTTDAWTTGIVFSFKSSGSQIGYAVGVDEKNLLGTGTQFQVQYGKNPDRDSLMFGLTRNYVFGTPLTLGAQLNSLSDGTNDSLSIALPFWTLQTAHGGAFGAKLYEGRVLQYANGDTTPADSMRKAFQLGYINPAIMLKSSTDGYLRLGLYAQLERNNFQDYALPASSIGRTITGAFGPFLALSRPKYQTVRYYQAGGRDEDLQLGYSATLGAYLAPAGWGYGSTGIGPTLTLSAGQGNPHAWFLESLAVTSLYSSAGLDSGTINGDVTAAWQPNPYHLFIGYVGAGAQKNGYPGEEYDLGFGYAVRAYPQHAYTGNRMFITAAEYRWMFIPDLAHLVAVGVSAFVDHAGAWYAGSPERTGTDVGIGLRIGARTGTAGYMMRADLSYRTANGEVPAGWVFSFGKGFVWQDY